MHLQKTVLSIIEKFFVKEEGIDRKIKEIDRKIKDYEIDDEMKEDVRELIVDKIIFLAETNLATAIVNTILTLIVVLLLFVFPDKKDILLLLIVIMLVVSLSVYFSGAVAVLSLKKLLYRFAR